MIQLKMYMAISGRTLERGVLGTEKQVPPTESWCWDFTYYLETRKSSPP